MNKLLKIAPINRTVSIFLLLNILIVGVVPNVYAKNKIAPSEIYKNNKDNVTTILVYDRDGKTVSQGTAVYLFANYFVTNTHVLERGESAKLVVNDLSIDTYDVMISSKLDVAYFSILPSDVERLGVNQIEYSLDIEVASDVFVISSPLGLSKSITQGIISADRDKIVQHTAPISPGSSGGALFNANGELIGIVNARSSGDSNISFAIKMDHVLADLTQNSEDMLMIFESPPLLSGKAILSMRTPHSGMTMFSLVELGSVESTGNVVDFIESTRAVLTDDEGGVWLELLNASSLNCNTRKLLSKTIGTTSLTSNNIEPMDAGEFDGQWLDIEKMSSKSLYEAMCQSSENIWAIKALLRRLHNQVQPLVPATAYKPFEIQ